MSVIMIPVSPYVKKEDGAQFFKNHKKGLIFTTVFVPVTTLIFCAIFIISLMKISELGHNFQSYIIIGTVASLLSAILYLVLALPLVLSKDYETSFFTKLKKYDDKEMINIKDLIDQKRLMWAWSAWMILFLLGSIFYVIPFFFLP